MAGKPPSQAPQYALTLMVLGNPCFLEISFERMEELTAAMSAIFEIRNIEERFDILFSNFIELEEELALRTIGNTYRRNIVYNDFFAEKLHYNRRVLNLLTTARVYADQTKGNFKELFQADDAHHAGLNNLFSSEYDSSQAYRILEAVRNYAQHSDLPVHGLTTGGRWINSGKENSELIENVSIYLDVAELRRSKKFKKSVLDDVTEGETKIDLKKYIRLYVEGFGRIHEAVRKMIEPVEISARSKIESAISEYYEKCPSEFGGLGIHIVKFVGDSRREKLTPVFTDAISFIDFMRIRNRNIASIAKRSISTTHQPDERKA